MYLLKFQIFNIKHPPNLNCSNYTLISIKILNNDPEFKRSHFTQEPSNFRCYICTSPLHRKNKKKRISVEYRLYCKYRSLIKLSALKDKLKRYYYLKLN
ncbi:hypothetical protein LCGC14_0496860 [marine sediment metagenome]|uniref:Uncharacterized protein n=1 Tax=marine sediment metagenome TaxID=412755 RepID=A0A0F9VDP5_9ZZZZ